MNGIVSVKTRDSGTEIILEPGDSTGMPSGRMHYITGATRQACQCMIVQS